MRPKNIFKNFHGNGNKKDPRNAADPPIILVTLRIWKCYNVLYRRTIGHNMSIDDSTKRHVRIS